MSRTLKELSERVEELAGSVSDLKNELKSFNNTWPQEGGDVFCIDINFEVTRFSYVPADWDIADENMFPTREEAEQKARWIKASFAIFDQLSGDQGGKETWPANGISVSDKFVTWPTSPFGCRDIDTAEKIAAMPEFKTFLSGGKE